MPEQPEQPPQTPQEPTEEKLEFLKREEVRTMAKDIARVREQESEKQRERVAGLQQSVKQAQRKPEVSLSQQAPPSKEELAPAVPAKRSPSRFEKVFVRVVIGGIIFFLLFNLIALGVWLFLQGSGE